jgi:hypothetical protein
MLLRRLRVIGSQGINSTICWEDSSLCHAGQYPRRACGNGRKISAGSGLLRNSTKIAARFLGLGQCSQMAPGTRGNLKRRPKCSRRLAADTGPLIARRLKRPAAPRSCPIRGITAQEIDDKQKKPPQNRGFACADESGQPGPAIPGPVSSGRERLKPQRPCPPGDRRSILRPHPDCRWLPGWSPGCRR